MLKRDPNCNKCGLCEGANTVCLLGSGGTKLKAMIIGEAPGKTEDEQGEPFVGRSGRMIDEMIADAGMDRADFYVTNAVRCRPPGNKTPSKREIKACREWLMKEIQEVKPKFIMVLGGTALESLLGVKGIRKLRGFPQEVIGSQFGLAHETVFVLPAYHPSYVMRDPRMEPVLKRDIKQFCEMVKRGGPRAGTDAKPRIVLTRQDLEEALEDIKASEIVAHDTETSGLNPFVPGSWVTSWGIATSNHQWCFPLNHPQGPLYRKFNAQRRRVKKIARALRGKKVVAHNGKFDALWLAAVFGVWVHCDFDTMLAHYNLNENALHGLDHLASHYFGAMDYDIPLEEKHGFGPLQRHCEYLALDIMYTRKLYFQLHKELTRDSLTHRVFKDITMPACRMFAEAEYRGVYVNQEELRKAWDYWTEIAEDRLAQLNKLVPDTRTRKDKKTKEIVTGINWGSPDQVAEVLFDRLKLTPLDKTGSGKKYSVSESVLLRLAKQHKVPKLILEWREAMKNRGTFIESWMEKCFDGRMHCSFKIHGTVTGRPSCEDPNLQQTPRDKRLRRLIQAPPGWILLDADLSQAELRIAAEMSEDQELMLSYQTGVDVHTLTVQRIFGIMNPTKEERKKGKAINFGFLYGMGWRKFLDYARDNYGVEFTEGEAKKIRKAFFRMYHGLPDWHKKQRKFVRKYGYVRSLLGRKRRLPDAQLVGESEFIQMKRAEAERQAINSPVQSFASDLNLLAAIELHNELPRDEFAIVGTIHDAILMEVREDCLMKHLPRIKRAMEHQKKIREWELDLRVPVISEIEIGCWGDPVAAFEDGKIKQLEKK